MICEATFTPEQTKLERKQAKHRRRSASRRFRRAMQPRPHRTDGPNDCLWRPEVRAPELYREAVELWESHRYRAAGAMARAAIENRLREIARKSPLVFALPKAQIVQCAYTLYSAGVIDSETEDELLKVSRVANNAAHGGDVSLEQIATLLRVARTIVCLWPVDAQPVAPTEPVELVCT